MDKNDLDSINFNYLGWKSNQFKLQLLKNNDLSLGIFDKHTLQAFILGDLIEIENKLDYEVLIIYVNQANRNKGYATKLLNEIPIILSEKKLTNIYLEVAANNTLALNLYKNNNYKQIRIRKNYYLINNKKIDAYCLKKIINE